MSSSPLSHHRRFPRTNRYEASSELTSQTDQFPSSFTPTSGDGQSSDYIDRQPNTHARPWPHTNRRRAYPTASCREDMSPFAPSFGFQQTWPPRCTCGASSRKPSFAPIPYNSRYHYAPFDLPPHRPNRPAHPRWLERNMGSPQLPPAPRKSARRGRPVARHRKERSRRRPARRSSSSSCDSLSIGARRSARRRRLQTSSGDSTSSLLSSVRHKRRSRRAAEILQDLRTALLRERRRQDPSRELLLNLFRNSPQQFISQTPIPAYNPQAQPPAPQQYAMPIPQTQMEDAPSPTPDMSRTVSQLSSHLVRSPIPIDAAQAMLQRRPTTESMDDDASMQTEQTQKMSDLPSRSNEYIPRRQAKLEALQRRLTETEREIAAWHARYKAAHGGVVPQKESQSQQYNRRKGPPRTCPAHTRRRRRPRAQPLLFPRGKSRSS